MVSHDVGGNVGVGLPPPLKGMATFTIRIKQAVMSEQEIRKTVSIITTPVIRMLCIYSQVHF